MCFKYYIRKSTFCYKKIKNYFEFATCIAFDCFFLVIFILIEFILGIIFFLGYLFH